MAIYLLVELTYMMFLVLDCRRTCDAHAHVCVPADGDLAQLLPQIDCQVQALNDNFLFGINKSRDISRLSLV